MIEDKIKKIFKRQKEKFKTIAEYRNHKSKLIMLYKLRRDENNISYRPFDKNKIYRRQFLNESFICKEGTELLGIITYFFSEPLFYGFWKEPKCIIAGRATFSFGQLEDYSCKKIIMKDRVEREKK